MSKNALFINKVFRSFLQMFSGEGVKTATSIVNGYFCALLLGPSVYGVWQTARVFISYGTFTSLGIPFVMRRDFVILRSEGKYSEANNLANLSLSYSLIISPIIAIIIAVIAISKHFDHLFQISLFAISIYYIIGIIPGFGNILHKGFNDYKTLANASLVFGFGNLIILPFIYFWGFKALLIGFLSNTLAQTVYFFLKRPIAYYWHWDLLLLKKVIITAFPIFLVTIISTVFASIDRIIIASMLSFKDVGLYSLSTFISQPITLLVSSFSIVLFTQLNERYGSSKESHVIEKHFGLPQSIFSNLIPPFIGMGLIALPILTQIFLPKYQGGIAAAQINVFAVFFLLLAGFSSNALFVLDKQKLSAISFFIAGCIKTIGSYLSIKAGYGIECVALFSVIGYFVYNSLMLYFINTNLGYNLNSYLLKLGHNLLCPLAILLFSLVYVIYHKEVFKFLCISNSWIQLLLGELQIIVLGSIFIFRAYKSIKSLSDSLYS